MNYSGDESDSIRLTGPCSQVFRVRVAALVAVLVLVSLVANGAIPRAHASSPVTLTVNGESFSTSIPVQIIDGYAMIPIQDVEFITGGHGTFYPKSGAYRYRSPDLQLLVVESRPQARTPEQVLEQKVPPVTEGDYLLVSVRFLADVFNWEVQWDQVEREVQITGMEVSAEQIEEHNRWIAGWEPEGTEDDSDSETIYDPTDEEMDLLVRLISAEAPNEPFEGMVAVGAVVLNRVESPDFPDTVKGVIMQPGQFCPVDNGQIDRPVLSDAEKAGERALSGEDPTDGAVYFFNPDRITSPSTLRWAESLPVYSRIGSHVFAGQAE